MADITDNEDDGLLSEDNNEIRLVPDEAREVWTRRSGKPYTREDYERDKKAREDDSPSRPENERG